MAMQRSTAKRRRELTDLILSEETYQVNTLSKRFGVSRETIRKDLIALEKEGIGRRGHRQFIIPSALKETTLDAHSALNREAKAQIAQKAAALVPAGSVVLLDSGSTAYEIAKCLAARSGLTVLTNSSLIPSVFSHTENTVISLGGELRDTSMAYVGVITLNSLQLMHSDIAFVGTDGFCDRSGPCTSVYPEAEIKKAMVQSAKVTYVVCDSSKFARDSVVQFCSWQDVDGIITNRDTDESALVAMRQNTEIILAP